MRKRGVGRIRFPILYMGLILALVGPNLSMAQTNTPWRLTLMPYYWGYSADTDVTVNGEKLKFDPGYMGDSGSFKPSSFGMAVDLYRDKWNILFNGESYVADDDGIADLLSGDVKDLTVNDAVLDLAGGYRFFFDTFGSTKLELNPQLGVRYRNFQVVADLADEEAEDPSITHTSWAPLIGGLILWQWSDRWAGLARGYVSGFGMGDAPDVDWTAMGVIRYYWTKEFYAGLGYRYQQRDWEFDSRSGRAGIDGSYDGVILTFGMDLAVQAPPVYVPPERQEGLLSDPTRYITDGLVGSIPADADPKKYRFRRWMSRTHDRINKEMHRWVEKIDTSLTKEDRPVLTAKEASRIYFRIDFELREANAGGVELDVKPNLETKLQLPNLKRDIKLVFSTESVDNTPGTDSFDEDRGLSVGFETDEFIFKKVKASVRLRSSSESLAEFEARVSWRPHWKKGKYYFEPNVTPYYRSDEGFGTRGHLLMQYRARQRGSIAYTPGFNWRESLDSTEWYHNFVGLYLFEGTEFDYHRGIGSFLTIRGDVDNDATLYRWIPLIYRAPLYGKWLYLAVGPQFKWAAIDDWEMEPSLRIFLEALFFGMDER